MNNAVAATIIAIGIGAANLVSAQPAMVADDPTIVRSESFLSEHPDLNFRLRGLQEYRKGEFKQAFEYFKRAARYGDKPAQAMVAGMLWSGEGVVANRPLAYAWIDLAAERGYPSILVFRERYWAQLSEGERRNAEQAGESVYREFGDSVAKKRLNAVLQSARRNTTGSHAGYVGTLVIEIDTPSGVIRIPGEQFYQDKYWQPALYWQWQDEGWKVPPKGTVDIGPLQTVPPTDNGDRGENPASRPDPVN